MNRQHAKTPAIAKQAGFEPPRLQDASNRETKILDLDRWRLGVLAVENLDRWRLGVLAVELFSDLDRWRLGVLAVELFSESLAPWGLGG